MKITGCCLPYGESKYHDAVQIGAFAHQDGAKVPLVRDFFFDNNNPENVIGHCILHDTDEGMMCDIHFNEEFSSNHDIKGFCSYYKIGAWAVQVKRIPILKHDAQSKFGNYFIVTGGRIVAVAMNEYCLERVVIEDE